MTITDDVHVQGGAGIDFIQSQNIVVCLAPSLAVRIADPTCAHTWSGDGLTWTEGDYVDFPTPEGMNVGFDIRMDAGSLSSATIDPSYDI